MLKFKQWLEAAATFGKQVHKKPIDVLQAIASQHPNTDNLVCSFTEINKLGINPGFRYKNPLGIYFYPFKYVVDRQMHVPFQKDTPYIQIAELTRPERILHMQKVSSANPATQKGLEYLIPEKEPPESRFEDSTPPDPQSTVQYLAKDFDIRSNYSALWLMAMKYANGNPLKWNQILRNKGIDGFIDYGTGTIHPNEPTQGLVFDKSALKVIHTINNKKHEQRAKPVNPQTLSLLRQYLKNIPVNLGQTFNMETAYHIIDFAKNAVMTFANAYTEDKNKMALYINSFVRNLQPRLRNMLPRYQRIYQPILKAFKLISVADNDIYSAIDITSEVMPLFSDAYEYLTSMGGQGKFKPRSIQLQPSAYRKPQYYGPPETGEKVEPPDLT